MDTLTRAMHDAVDNAPTTLAATGEEWVSTSWRSGRRRRAVRGVAAGAGLAAAAALVVSLVVSGVGGLPSASVPADGSSRSAREGVTSYPQRIGHQWWVRDLPATPGPMAGLLEVNHQDGEEFSTTWEVVSPSGRRFATTHATGGNDAYPVLSADGTRLATLSPSSDGVRLVVHDLLTGEKVTAPQVGAQADGGPRYQLAGQSPGFFSLSGQLAVLNWNPDAAAAEQVVVVDPATGATTGVPGMKQPAGWLDDDRLVGRTFSDDETVPVDDRRPEIVVWDRQTGRTQSLGRAEVPDPGPGMTASLRGQWWGAVRSDGTLWMTVDVYASGAEGSQPAQWLLGYALPSLRRVGLDGLPAPTSEPFLMHEEGVSSPAWRGDTPLTVGDSQPLQVTPVGRPDDPLVVVQGSVPAAQVTWAQDAIDGSPSWALFGTSDFALFWWWTEIALVVGVLGAYRWGLARRRRRKAAAAVQD